MICITLPVSKRSVVFLTCLLDAQRARRRIRIGNVGAHAEQHTVTRKGSQLLT